MLGPKVVVHSDHVISIECHMYAYLLDIPLLKYPLLTLPFFVHNKFRNDVSFELLTLGPACFVHKKPEEK